MDVFSAFPNGIVSGRYVLLEANHGTLVGTEVVNIGTLDVIVEDANSTDISYAPNSQPLDADMLLYVKPGQLPTTNTNALVARYMVLDSEDDTYYAIVDASVGKNQETGELEHIELMVKQTEVVDG